MMIHQFSTAVENKTNEPVCRCQPPLIIFYLCSGFKTYPLKKLQNDPVFQNSK
jgi:hypothetical protein